MVGNRTDAQKILDEIRAMMYSLKIPFTQISLDMVRQETGPMMHSPHHKVTLQIKFSKFPFNRWIIILIPLSSQFKDIWSTLWREVENIADLVERGQY